VSLLHVVRSGQQRRLTASRRCSRSPALPVRRPPSHIHRPGTYDPPACSPPRTHRHLAGELLVRSASAHPPSRGTAETPSGWLFRVGPAPRRECSNQDNANPPVLSCLINTMKERIGESIRAETGRLAARCNPRFNCLVSHIRSYVNFVPPRAPLRADRSIYGN